MFTIPGQSFRRTKGTFERCILAVYYVLVFTFSSTPQIFDVLVFCYLSCVHNFALREIITFIRLR